MKVTRVRTILASLTATVAVGVAAVPAQAPAPAPVSAPVRAAVSGARAADGHGAGQVFQDTCPQLERQLPALARQGHRYAGCVTPAPARSAASSHTADVAAAGISLPSWCKEGAWEEDRIEICLGGIPSTLTWEDTKTRKVLGTAAFFVVQDIQLNPLGRTFAENLELRVTDVKGELPGATWNLAVSCGGTCTATSHFPNGSPIVKGSDITTAIEYSDSTTTVNETHSSYTLSFGPGTEIPGEWASPAYRCDDLFAPQGAGCVAPGFIPTMTSMARLPGIAANIKQIQQAGPHHYGLEAGGTPLTRNTSLEAANRAISCPKSRNKDRPTGMSCDEYPFATTDQGASQAAPADWGWAWVPESEQNSQGGLVNGFYKQQRILDGANGTGDPFWVAV